MNVICTFFKRLFEWMTSGLHRRWRQGAFCAGLLLLLGAVFAAILAVPAFHVYLKHTVVVWSLGGFFALLVLTTLGSLYLRRFLSVLFHGGVILILIGAWRTARSAEEFECVAYGLPVLETDDTALAFRTFSLGDETFRVGDFAQVNYPGTTKPKQWWSDLHLPDGSCKRALVNSPVRYNGWTIYQMAFGISPRGAQPIPRFFVAPRGYDVMTYENGVFPYGFFAFDYHDINGPYDYPFYDPMTYAYVHGEKSDLGVYYTGLLARRDPGVVWTFLGYGAVVLAALGFALRETLR